MSARPQLPLPPHPPVVMPLDVPLEPAPVVITPTITFQRRRTRPRVRRVTRIVRHVDTWSIFKIALLFNLFLLGVFLVSAVLLWHVAIATGTTDTIASFLKGVGWKAVKFNGGAMFHGAWVVGLYITVALTGMAVLFATLFNIITDLVGGIRITVLEEEVLARQDRLGRVVTYQPNKPKPYDAKRDR